MSRTASVRAVCEARVWALERRVFQQIMVTTGQQRIDNQVNTKILFAKKKNIRCDGGKYSGELPAVRAAAGAPAAAAAGQAGGRAGDGALARGGVHSQGGPGQSSVELSTKFREVSVPGESTYQNQSLLLVECA